MARGLRAGSKGFALGILDFCCDVEEGVFLGFFDRGRNRLAIGASSSARVRFLLRTNIFRDFLRQQFYVRERGRRWCR